MKRLLNPSPRRRSASSAPKSSWRRRRWSAASCPGSCRTLWTTLRDRWTHTLSAVSHGRHSDVTDASAFLLQVETNMQKVLAKERTSQSKALDLQSQLSRAKAEQSQLQRSKEEVGQEVRGQSSAGHASPLTCSPADGAPLPDSAAEHEGQAGAVRLQEPQLAELRPLSQNLVRKRLF